MANKQTYKDRKRDPNPRNRPPRAQVKEQKVRGRKPVDKPAKQPTTRARKPRTEAQKAVRRAREQARPEPVQKAASASNVANVLLRVTDTQSGTIHEEASRLKIRQTEETSPVETVTVEGNKVEVVARPDILHPVELLPHQRDTVVKDRLRESGDHEETLIADGVASTEPRDWHPHAVALEQQSPQGRLVSAPARAKKAA